MAERLFVSEVGRVNHAINPANMIQLSKVIAALSPAAKAATAEAIRVPRINLPRVWR
jgi:hypothetical protein